MIIEDALDKALRRVIRDALAQNAEQYQSDMRDVLNTKGVDPLAFLDLLNKLVHIILINDIPWPQETTPSHVGEAFYFVKVLAPKTTEASLLDLMTFLTSPNGKTKVGAIEAGGTLPALLAYLLKRSSSKRKTPWDILDEAEATLEASDLEPGDDLLPLLKIIPGLFVAKMKRVMLAKMKGQQPKTEEA